jgi:16S rRNA (guanine966-N2)-methyltransferase
MSLGDLSGQRVVDLFAGSGALGIEALSRGARFVDFVDSGRAARDSLARNLATLGLSDRAKVWPLVLPAGLSRLAASMQAADLVLVDPPYGGEEAREVLERLGREKVLREGARLVVERHQKDELPRTTGTLVLARERRYGETVVNLYDVGTSSSPEAELP